jgi:hypothetical protein
MLDFLTFGHLAVAMNYAASSPSRFAHYVSRLLER